ncbi:MAG: ATP-binding protein [Bacteroidota bacterium]|jgi:predicted AAA+ superfamily ATPase
MVLKETLETCVIDQKKNLEHQFIGVNRALSSNIKLSKQYITIITGIRRCGKSTLMTQLMKKHINEFAYFNFEDPRVFGFEVQDFQKLEDALGNKKYFFFDEIQNVEKWELFIRKLHDKGKVICITGSNASLLSKELGTRLTGRNVQKELFPFDYEEFCRFNKLKSNLITFDRYLAEGGFPAYLQNADITYLQQLFRDILYRDIIVRYGVRNAKLLEQLGLYLLSNIGKEYSLNGLKKIFNIGSANSVSDYISWFEDSYLLFSLPKFSWSLKSVAVNPKKIYGIDTGFIRANSVSFSSDNGRFLENVVYLHLRKSFKEIYYYREKGECDFIVKDKNKVTQVLQVCYELNDDNLQRELNGLNEALDYFELKEGFLITRKQKDEFVIGNKKIKVFPAYEWMMR